MPAGDMRRIGGGSDDDKIVPRDLPVRRAMPLRDELLFGVGVMHEDEIGVGAPRVSSACPVPCASTCTSIRSRV